MLLIFAIIGLPQADAIATRAILIKGFIE